ncbi:MAG: L-type lectin-domain containing protein [Bernardetiaceae bacterium]|jgi:hypothetical protein|nr:L-type lectin-domain containing protein [Bernardetiaceae bacterium]
MKKLLLGALLAWPLAVLAQQSPLHYKLMGDAQLMPNDCIQLTPDVEYAEGIAYYQTRLDLSRFFQVDFEIYLGNKDEGADGITFVLHDDPRAFDAFGTWGECMGYGRWSKWARGGTFIAPSVAVEFDTYTNYRQNDPEFDHVAYLEDGTNYHDEFWHNKDGAYNLEDDQLHNFSFRWEPRSKRVSVMLDGQLVHTAVRDLVSDVFGGHTQVIWGFTASTGRAHNLQYFCLKQIAEKMPETDSRSGKTE